MLLAHTLKGEGHDASEDGTGRGVPLIATNVDEARALVETIRSRGVEIIPCPDNGTEAADVGDRWHIQDSCLNIDGLRGVLGLSSPPSVIPILEVGKGTTSRGAGPNGAGIGKDGDPMYTLQAGAQHAIAFHGSQDPSVSGDVTHPVGRNGGRETSVATPIDMRQASRGAKMTNNRKDGGAPGTGIGNPGDPAPTLGGCHTPAIAFSSKDHGADAEEEVAPTLRSMGHDKSHPNAGGQVAVAVQEDGLNGCREYDTAGSLRANGPGTDPVGTRVRQGMRVRRLTPRECERLQGFPDDYTLITIRKKPAADGPRYKAIGNSMAVTVMQWLGRRVDSVDAL